MNLALIAQSEVFATLQGLVRWFISAKMPTPRSLTQYEPAKPTHSPRLIDFHTTPIGTGDENSKHHKPLRVVRVLEAGQAQSSVGRMVISGRMADVCAELDRLAARETALL